MTKCEVLLSYAKLFVSFGQKQKENSSILFARGFAHNGSTVDILVPLWKIWGFHSAKQSGGHMYLTIYRATECQHWQAFDRPRHLLRAWLVQRMVTLTWRVVRTCYFAKLRPCSSIIVGISFASRPLYFVVIQFIVLHLVVVSLCVAS